MKTTTRSATSKGGRAADDPTLPGFLFDLDGTLIDRNTFLAQIGRGSTVKNIREHDVVIRIVGEFAIIHARTSYQKPDGTQGAGRYTDDWQLRGGRWQCVSAHVSRA